MAIQPPDFRTLADLASLSPPADPNVEATVLQACALHPAWFRRNVAALHASAFTHPGYRVMYEHMQDALVSDQPLDVVTLTGRLREAGQLDLAGGPAGVMEIFAGGMPSEAAGKHYLARLLENFAVRKHIEAFTKGLGYLFRYSIHSEADAAIAAIEAAKGAIEEAGRMPGQRLGRQRLIDAVDAAVAEIQERLENPNVLPGWPTPWPSFNRNVGGLRKGRFTVFAGMPGDGKSVAMQNALMAACLAGAKVGIYSLEMPNVEVGARVLAQESGVSINSVMQGLSSRADLEAISQAVRRLKGLGADVVACDGASGTDIIADIEGAGYDVVMVDYLQLIEEPDAPRNANRQELIAGISRRLKRVALRANCHVLSASQLNDKGQLRESRAIGQDADAVFLINKCPNSREDGRAEEGDWTDADGFDDSRRVFLCDKNRGGKRYWDFVAQGPGDKFTFTEAANDR